MMRLIKRTRRPDVSFCERCGSVCDAGCRAGAIREQARMRAFASGWRPV